jgi:hypothetical protein
LACHGEAENRPISVAESAWLKAVTSYADEPGIDLSFVSFGKIKIFVQRWP